MIRMIQSRANDVSRMLPESKRSLVHLLPHDIETSP